MYKNNPILSSRPIAIWLLIGVVMIIIQIILGGITRLSGSGLSITEWNIITGTIPPTNEQQWLSEFDKYKQTPQYQLLNFDFAIKDFKFIFFWEWLHRFWARLLGVVFAIPFIFFLIQGRIRPSMVKPMLILVLLGALQGAIGWIMVQSGLTGDVIYVKPIKLAMHFLLAMVLLCYTFWFALKLLVPKQSLVENGSARKWNIIILLFLFLQFFFGALMAGLKTASAAATWPTINGKIIPSVMNVFKNNLTSLFENKITIHFIHRGLAYLLVVLIILFTSKLYSTTNKKLFRTISIVPLILVCMQLLLGIFSVLHALKMIPNHWGLFEWLALLHQLIAMLLLLSLMSTLYFVSSNKSVN